MNTTTVLEAVEPGGIPTSPRSSRAPLGAVEPPLAVDALAMMPLVSALMLTVFCLWGIARFGSIAVAANVIAGYPLTVDEPTASVGIVPRGTVLDVPYVLRNHSSEPIRVIGCAIGCWGRVCTSPANEVPFVIGPGESSRFHVTLDFKLDPGEVHSSFVIYTNIPGQPEVELGVVGSVL